MRIISFTVMLLCFLSVFVSANSEYRHAGTPAFNFVLNNSLFTSSLTSDDYSVNTRNIGSAMYMPLVADLNGDGLIEILVIDGSTLRVYHYINDALVINTSISTGFAAVSSYMAIYDLDNDDELEVLVNSDDSELVRFFNYSGILAQEYVVNVSQTCDNAGQEMTNFFVCDEVEQNCIITCEDTSLYAVGFNTSQAGTKFQLTSTAGRVYCHPGIRGATVRDIDKDGVTDFLFSLMNIHTPGVETMEVFKLQFGADGQGLNANSTRGIDNPLVTENMYDATDSTASCVTGNNQGRRITAPLVHDFDVGGDDEFIVGYMVDADEFKIKMYKSDGSEVGSSPFPQIEDADGIIVSNPFLADVFDDTGREDFCVMGFEEDDGIIDILCGSIASADIHESHEYTMDISEFGNLTEVAGGNIKQSYMIHAVQVDPSYGDEVLTAYGTVKLDTDSCNIIGDCDAVSLWLMPSSQRDGAVITADVQGVGTSDMIVLTNSNIWYIDDGFTDQVGFISEYFIDPCTQNVWEVGTSVEVRIIVTDPEGLNVNASAILYDGLSFNQTSAWVSGSSGATFVFDFVANQTLGSATLLLRGKDIQNPDSIDVISKPFTVGTSGISKDQGCVENVQIGAEADNESADPSEISGSDRAALRQVVFGAGGTIDDSQTPIVAVIAIVLTIIVVALVLVKGGMRDGMAVIYLPLGAGAVVWLFAVWAGAIPGWTVIVAILMSAAIIGWKVYQGRSSPFG